MHRKIDTEKLLCLLRDFHCLTDMRIVIFDTDMRKLCSYPESECAFCESMKQNPESRRLCRACDEEACRKCLSLGKLHVYECHAGLIEAAFPLKFGGIQLGYIMLGQLVIAETLDSKRAELLYYAARYIDDADTKIALLTKKRAEQIDSAARLLEVCASYLLVREMIGVDDGGMAFRLAEYIGRNLAEPLTVELLCEHFSVSRNRLYRMSREYFGTSIAAYIRARRVSEATALMEKGATVSEAAAAVGIDDYNYFSKLYKRETGELPSKVKKEAVVDRSFVK